MKIPESVQNPKSYLWIGLFLAMTGAYLMTSSGDSYVTDCCAMYYMSAGLIDRGWFDVQVNINTQGGRVGPDGRYYMPFGLMQPVLAMPFVLAGRALIPLAGSASIPFLVATWFNAAVTAALITLIAVFFTDLMVPAKRAVWGAVAIGFSTPLWVYSRTFFAEPLSSLGTLASVWELYRYSQAPSRGRLIRSGLWISLAMLARPLSGVVLPVLFLYLASIGSERMKTTGSRVSLGPFMILGAMLALGIGLLLLYNQIRFGSFIETGYDRLPTGRLRSFTRDPITGLKVLLLSPGKSIFVFNPLVFGALTGIAIWIRKRVHTPELIVMLLVPVMYIGVLCRWAEVEGGVAWGPRLALPGIPVLLMALAPLLRSSRMSLWIVLPLAIAGFGVQLPGILVNFAAYIDEVTNDYFNPLNGDYQMSFNPFPGHLERIVEYARDIPYLSVLPEEEAARRRTLQLLNHYGEFNFWWLHAWRDGVRPSFIFATSLIHLLILLIGLVMVFPSLKKELPEG